MIPEGDIEGNGVRHGLEGGFVPTGVRGDDREGELMPIGDEALAGTDLPGDFPDRRIRTIGDHALRGHESAQALGVVAGKGDHLDTTPEFGIDLRDGLGEQPWGSLFQPAHPDLVDFDKELDKERCGFERWAQDVGIWAWKRQAHIWLILIRSVIEKGTVSC